MIEPGTNSQFFGLLQFGTCDAKVSWQKVHFLICRAFDWPIGTYSLFHLPAVSLSNSYYVWQLSFWCFSFSGSLTFLRLQFPLCEIATESPSSATESWEIFTELSKLHLTVSNAKPAVGSKVKGSHKMTVLHLVLTSFPFAGVPCATGDRHTGSPPYPGQHQSRGKLPDPRGRRLNKHGE